MGRVIFLDKGSVSVDGQSLLLGSWRVLHWLPMAAVINHRKLGGLNQHRFIISQLSKVGFQHGSPFCCFPLFLCINLWGRLSYLSLLFFGTLHSDAYIFPFLLCFSLLFFSQLFVRPPQAAILLFCISFPWGWSWSLSLVQCQEPHSIVHQALYQI